MFAVHQFLKNFAGINFHESPISKISRELIFANRHFRESEKEFNFAKFARFSSRKNFFPWGNAPVKLFCPHPPRAPPGTSLFFWVAPVLLSLYLFLAPPYIITIFTLFSSAPPFFYHTHYSSDPGAAPGGWGRTIWPAHNIPFFYWRTRNSMSCVLQLFKPKPQGDC